MAGELHQEMENLLEEENGIMARNFIIFEESSKLNQESNFTIDTTLHWDAVEPLVETVGWDFHLWVEYSPSCELILG